MSPIWGIDSDSRFRYWGAREQGVNVKRFGEREIPGGQAAFLACARGRSASHHLQVTIDCLLMEAAAASYGRLQRE
jgi:hypothetical protein